MIAVRAALSGHQDRSIFQIQVPALPAKAVDHRHLARVSETERLQVPTVPRRRYPAAQQTRQNCGFPTAPAFQKSLSRDRVRREPTQYPATPAATSRAFWTLFPER